MKFKDYKTYNNRDCNIIAKFFIFDIRFFFNFKCYIMEKTIYFIALIIFFSCNSREQNIYSNISKKDSIRIEKKLLALKNWSFKECYSKSEMETYKKKGKIFNDTICRINDLTEYYCTNNSDIDLTYIFEDNNRKNLISKWVNKKEYIPYVNPPDFPDGSLNMVRALDFYNSLDLKKYIDSVRTIELNKISHKN
jgi:hypothetical protein